jgi:hypothetical protein
MKEPPAGGSAWSCERRYSMTVVDERGRDMMRMSETMPHPIKL